LLSRWDEAAFDRSFDINFKGPFFLIQALLPVFNNPASIVLMTSSNAHIGMPNSSVYGATKAALLSLSLTPSGELISRGIRVNAISGGRIATPLYNKLGMGEKELKSLESQIPARRLGTPSEVAQAVVYFASDDSAFTVGSELVIDGNFSSGPISAIPALTKRMSSRLNSLRIVSATSFCPWASPAFDAINSTPSLPNSLRATSRLSWLRAVIAMRAPSLRNSRAVSSPMPLVPPVINAFLLFSRFIVHPF
jgi:hypothetical protein